MVEDDYYYYYYYYYYHTLMTSKICTSNSKYTTIARITLVRVSPGA